jgi:hypothetical protein
MGHAVIRIVIVSAAAFAASAFYPAKAAEAPWCAVTNTGLDMRWDCRFQSAEECAPHVLAGNRGFCNQNPYYVGQASQRRTQKRGAT